MMGVCWGLAKTWQSGMPRRGTMLCFALSLALFLVKGTSALPRSIECSASSSSSSSSSLRWDLLSATRKRPGSRVVGRFGDDERENQVGCSLACAGMRLRGGGAGLMKRIGGLVRRRKDRRSPGGEDVVNGAGQPPRRVERDVEGHGAIKAPSINAMHLPRKAFHIVLGCTFAYILNGLNEEERQTFALIFYALGFGGIFGETLRINTRVFNQFFFALFGAFMREHELKSRFSGMVFYLLGVAGAASMGRLPGVIGILMLAIGDPAAGATGIASQRMLEGSRLLPMLTLRNGKTLLGSLGCFVACSSTVIRILSIGQLDPDSPSPGIPRILAVSTGVALTTCVAEAIIPTPPLALPFAWFPLGLDDNLLLPLIGAASAALLLDLTGIGSPRLRQHLIF